MRFDVRDLCPELSKNFRKAVADLRDRGYDVHCTSRGTPVFCDPRDTKNLGLLTLDEDLKPLHLWLSPKLRGRLAYRVALHEIAHALRSDKRHAKKGIMAAQQARCSHADPNLAQRERDCADVCAWLADAQKSLQK